MPIEKLKQELYDFIKDRNSSDDLTTYWRNVRAKGRSLGYSDKETGYALYLLREEGRVYLRKYQYITITRGK